MARDRIPEQTVLGRAAAALDLLVAEIISHWLERLGRTIYSAHPELDRRALIDHAPALVHGVAEALRGGEPGVVQAPWAETARAHALARRQQKMLLGDLVREYQLMREEIWRAMGSYLAHAPAQHVYDIAGNLDVALDTMATIATSTYGAELQRSLEEAARLAAIVQYSQHPIIAADLQGTVTAWNPGAERLYGYTAEEMIGRPLSAVIPPERRGELADVVDRTRQGESIPRYATVRVRKDGSRVDVALEASPIRDREGRVTGVSWTAHDITEEVRLRQERERLFADVQREAEAHQRLLDRQNQLFRVAMVVLRESSVEGLLEAVAEGARVLGGAALAISGHGYVSGEFRIGATSRAAGAAACPPGLEFQVARGGVHMDLIYERESIRLTDEEMRRHPRWWGLPPEHGPLRGLLGARMVDRDGNPNGLIMLTNKEQGEFTAEDEALLRQLAAIASLGLQHIEAREEAEAAVRLRDQFLSVAAHELRTPLASLRGQAELTMKRIAQGRIQDVEQVNRPLQVIDRQVDKLSTLVSQLLDISRIDTGELELERRTIDLVPLARAMVETMQAGAARHALSLRAPESLPASVDALRLEQVLYNLLDNAIRYSPKGGPVTVELSTPNDDTVRLAVRDYGIGVPPEQRPRLFSRFFQAAKRPAGGLGLGLYISRRIVELHGGRIWAEFPEDGGSRFVVELPRGAAESEGTETNEGTKG